jgi:hypothetical protein
MRHAIAAAKIAGDPVIQVGRGLTLPVVWEYRYEVVYEADLSLPWLIGGVAQLASLGNPAAGERKRWKHSGGRFATRAEFVAIGERIQQDIAGAAEAANQEAVEEKRAELARIAETTRGRYSRIQRPSNGT